VAERAHGGRSPRRCAALACSGLILVSFSARAAEPNLDEDPGFLRNGFFARFALGSGVFTASSGKAVDSRNFVGLPVSLAVYLGKAVSRFVSLGGGYARDGIGRLSSSDEVIDGDEPQLADVSFYLEQLALYAEVYPGPSSPFYVYATLGFGTLNVRRSGDEFKLPLLHWIGDLVSKDPSGSIVSFGVGYESWLFEHWALGVSGGVQAAFLDAGSFASAGTAVQVIQPSVLVTLSYY
jgi:hypothetical protein